MGDADVVRAELRNVVVREVHAVRAPDVLREPADLVEVLDRRAAVELAAVLLFLHGLREVRVQPEPEPARQLCRLGHQLARDRERRARRDRDLDLCAVRETGCGLCRSKCFVACLHDRVGRKPALRLAEVHRAPGGDDADAELARGPDLRFEQALHARREEVVVIEHRRAAGERELGETDSRRCVLGFLVDRRPDRVERLEPAEEVLVLCACAREVLPEVVMGVDEPGRDDGAGEVVHVVGFRFRACTGGS